jgi:anti-sigma factor RsiW
VRLAARDLECIEAVALITDYLEGALSWRRHRRLEQHLRGCANCTAYLEQIRATITATARIEPEDLSDEARADLVALYRRFRRD